MPIHERHLKFVLEVAHRAQSTNDERRVDASREIDEQSLELLRVYTIVAARHLPNHFDALVRCEQRLLRAVARNCHDELVDELAAARDEIFVAACDWIEASRVNRDCCHAIPRSDRW